MLVNVITLLGLVFSFSDAELTRQSDDPSMEGCGISKVSSSSSSKIVGGRDAIAGECPWLLSMEMQAVPLFTDFKHICGASLVNRNWAITAAHCIAGGYFTRYRVVAGAYNMSTKAGLTTKHNVLPYVHEGYNPLKSLKNDIAMLRLATPVPMDAFDGMVNGVCIPPSSSANSTSGMATVTGWGATSEGGRMASRPQAVDVPIVTNEQCKDAYNDDMIADSMVCAGYDEGGKDSCQGDSGGPMVQPSDEGPVYLIGIVSWGKGCAQKGYPGVYTRTASYVDWISRTMQMGIPTSTARPTAASTETSTES